MRRGRPLRFLVVALGGWTAVRVALLWPVASLPAGPVLASRSVDHPRDLTRWLREPVLGVPIAPWPLRAGSTLVQRRAAPGAGRMPPPAPGRRRYDALALAAMVRYGPAVPVERDVAPTPGVTPPLRPVDHAAPPRRLAGSAWLIARGGRGGDPLAAQLGGSQAGARLTYALDRGRRIAASARVAGPLGAGGGAEAGLGIDWQPTRAPLHLLAEQRIPLDGGHGGPALLAVGGIGPVAVAPGVRIEAYAQGGVVFRDRAEGFGDGAARLTTPIAALGAVRVDLGAGAWGGIQRGVRRLDLGPTLGAAVPVIGRTLRVTLDWRQRVAGNARPGSGPALSVGTDF